MAYNKTTWIDDVTPLNAKNLNNMEDGIEKMYKATINGKVLSDNPSLTATDVGALPDSTEIPIVDKNFSPTSANAQSGKAVAEAVASKADKTEVNKLKSDLDSLNDSVRTEEYDEAVYFTDSRGNVVAKTDKDGITSVGFADKQGRKLSDLDTKVSVIDECNGEYCLTDRRGHIVFKIDSRGYTHFIDGENVNKFNIQNDLRQQNIISPIIGSYGQDNAVYKIDNISETFRMAFDFKLNENLNINDENTVILSIVGDNGTKNVTTIKSSPTTLKVKRNGEQGLVFSQAIGYRSGFNICGTNFIRDATFQKPIVGNLAFSMWLKGNFSESTDFPSNEEVLNRASWLSAHSSSTISFSNGKLIISGIADNTIEVDTADKSLSVFYEELLNAAGEYFDFHIADISATKNASDLLEFGEIPLVSLYYQQTDKSSTSLSYNYDSYPVMFPLAIDDSIHTAEIIGCDGYIYVCIDGDTVKYRDNITSVIIGGTELLSGNITCRNLELSNGNIGDAIIDSDNRIVSSRNPKIVGVMQHIIENKYEGQELSQSYYASISRMKDVFKLIKDSGYTVISLDDVCKWVSGSGSIPARSVFFLCTINITYDNFLRDLTSRTLWTRDNIPIIIGSIVNTDGDKGQLDVNKMFNNVISARAIGVSYISHLYDHDVMPDYKNSLILQQELIKLIRLCLDCGIDTRMYSYGWSCYSINYFNMLSINGFLGSMGTTNEIQSINNGTTNPYHINRVNLSDATSISTVKKYLS